MFHDVCKPHPLWTVLCARPLRAKKGYFKGLEEDTKSITYEDGRDDNLPTQGHT